MNSEYANLLTAMAELAHRDIHKPPRDACVLACQECVRLAYCPHCYTTSQRSRHEAPPACSVEAARADARWWLEEMKGSLEWERWRWN